MLCALHSILNKHIQYVAVLIFSEDFSEAQYAALALLFVRFKAKE